MTDDQRPFDRLLDQDYARMRKWVDNTLRSVCPIHGEPDISSTATFFITGLQCPDCEQENKEIIV